MQTDALNATIACEPRDGGPWTAVALLGALWGVAVSLLESVAIPTVVDDPGVFWRLVLWIMPGWCVVGIGLVLWIRHAGARLERPAFFVASVLGCAIVLSALWSGLYAAATAAVPASGMDLLFPHGTEPFASFLYQAWVVAFYGGLAMFAWSLNGRIERTRRVLAQARLVRLRAEVQLAEAQLAALRSHVDPRFLLRVMTQIEQRYARTPVAADRLLGLLVAFLRLAMPGVRSGRATLAGELALARAYGALRSDVDPAQPRWRIVAPDALPEAGFPPLLLLSLLDGLGAALPAGSRGEVTVACAAGEVLIRFDDGCRARAGWFSPELAYRLRVGLATLYRAAWTIELRAEGAAGRPALELRIAHGAVAASVPRA